MFDRETRLLLILGLLNDAFAEARSISVNLRDFIGSHPEMGEEIEEFELLDLLNQVSELERRIDELMSSIKKEVYS
jgi:hypothetical protein